MSQENVERIERAMDAVNRRDLDTLLALADDDVEAFPILAAMEGGYRGHEGIRRWWASLLSTFPDFHTEILELRDVGDLTIATLRMRGRGVESDTPVDSTLWQVSEFREGKCVGWRAYTTQAEALEAVGISD